MFLASWEVGLSYFNPIVDYLDYIYVYLIVMIISRRKEIYDIKCIHIKMKCMVLLWIQVYKMHAILDIDTSLGMCSQSSKLFVCNSVSH